MPEPLSQHHFPRLWLRRVVTWALAAAIAFMSLALIVQIILAFTLSPLFFGGALFSAILLIPLLMRTVLHPAIDVMADGLTVNPMLWPAQNVPWEALTGITAHPLLYNDDAMGKTLHGKNYRPREGAVILVSRDAGLWFPYRIIGGVAGAGNTPAFAISSTTHTDYAGLIAAIRARVPDSHFG
jgi:hypothetical protein